METQSFSFDTLHQMYERAPTVQRIVNRKVVEEKDLNEVTNYVKKYFFPLKTGGSMVWDSGNGQFFFYPKETLNDVYLNRFPEEVKKWYGKNYFVLYDMVNDLSLPTISGTKLNMCKGFKHKAKPYNEYSGETKEKVNSMLNHIKLVIANKDDNAYKYIINWLARMCQGKKNTTILYLKSQGGTGKSTFTDFILEWVLGWQICVKAVAEVLTTPYNKPLCGKLLAMFEELPTFRENQWSGVSGKLKDLATGTQLGYTEKYEKCFQAENITNFIINTNVEAIKHSEDRRYFIADISLEKQQDYKYFALIKDNCYNQEVGEAFFSLMCSIDVSNFHPERDMPETRAKLNAIASRLESTYQYLKECFILKRKGIIKCPTTELYRDYCDYCDSAHKRAIGKHEFFEKLRELKILPNVSNGRQRYNVTIETLNAIAEKRKWISDYDEYTDKIEDPTEDNIEDENVLVIHNHKYEKILKQMKKIFPNLEV